MSQKTCLILTNHLHGLYNFRKEVVHAILETGVAVCISAPKDKDSFVYFKKSGCKIIITNIDRRGMNPLKDLKLLCHYIRLVRQIKPSFVLGYTIKPNIYGGLACRLCHIPFLPNVTGLGTAVENPGFLQLITTLLYKISFKGAYTVFFQNEENQRFCISRKLISCPSVLLPGSGVNLQYHTFKKYPEFSGRISFIFIGRIMKEKGIEEYLEMAQRIKEKYEGVDFHILGSYEEKYAEKLRDFEKSGIVIYHGSTNDVRPFIERSWCTVHPSYYPEGMSNVLLESCAAGRPIITTDHCGCREIVDDGVNGFIVHQRNVNELIQKVMDFINLPYSVKKMMGEASRQKVEKEFDRNIVISNYLKAINSIQ